MSDYNSRRSFLSKAAIASAMARFASLSVFGNGYENAVDNYSKPSAPSDLKITEIKCGYIRGSLFVKIFTNQDIYGCGEGVDAVMGTYHLVKNFEMRLKGLRADTHGARVHQRLEPVGRLRCLDTGGQFLLTAVRAESDRLARHVVGHLGQHAAAGRRLRRA